MTRIRQELSPESLWLPVKRTLGTSGKGTKPNAARAPSNEEEDALFDAGQCGDIGPKEPFVHVHAFWFSCTRLK